VRAHEVDLISMVQGTKQFQVPLYQRPYSWGVSQLRQIWMDLLAEAERLKDEQGGSGHFIGSVVLAPSPVALGPSGLSRWLVVDGQQRLTTLMIALTAIRDHVEEDEPQVALRIDVEYLINQFEQGDARLRLLPTQADRAAFRACVLRLPGADAADGVGAAYRFFRAELVVADDPDDPHDIARIEQVIRQRLRLVEIVAEPGDNVHRIFQSLNNTGLQLSQADLFRNHLFMLLPTRAEQVYEDVWLPMQEALRPQLELLMWLELVLWGHDKAKQGDVFRMRADLLRERGEDEDRVVAEVQEFARRSRHLALILDPTGEKDLAVRDALTRLEEWGGQIAYPTAMLLLDHRERRSLPSADVARGLALVESFLVRRMIVGVAPNNLNRILNAVPREVGDADDVVDALLRYLSGTRRYWPSDAAVRDAVLSKPFYWSGRGPQRSFVLRRIEVSYGSPEPVDWSKAKATVEHVMPQSLTEEWAEQLAPGAEREGVAVTDLHDSLVHTLGNLTLTALNPVLSNHPFERKRQILERGSLAMNREIRDADRWGADEIQGRSARLAARIVKIWPGPLHPEDALTGSRDWTQLHRALALMPAGSWTTYTDVAELIGSHPAPVGQHLAHVRVVNSWRVLTSEGRTARQFRWLEPDRTGTQQEALHAEGVTFDGAGRAAPEERLAAVDLARLIGLDVPEDLPPTVPLADGAAYAAFLAQLDEAQDDATDRGVRLILDGWQRLGCALSFGSGTETSCFMMVADAPRTRDGIWPLALYPVTGTAEVVFQHLARRRPFDDPALRRELLDRLNEVHGITLPAVKLSMRPSFPLSVLADPDACQRVAAALEWFALVCATDNETDSR
jgi:alkylated DNA nucleotide flippase Atl1